MPPLTSKQRSFLRSKANALNPLILIGKNGLTDEVVRATHEALDDHELIKVKFNGFKEDKREIVEDIAARTHCEAISIIGNVAILFRYQHDNKKRKIDLPA